jgi:hypothetical protein
MLLLMLFEVVDAAPTASDKKQQSSRTAESGNLMLDSAKPLDLPHRWNVQESLSMPGSGRIDGHRQRGRASERKGHQPLSLFEGTYVAPFGLLDDYLSWPFAFPFPRLPGPSPLMSALTEPPLTAPAPPVPEAAPAPPFTDELIPLPLRPAPAWVLLVVEVFCDALVLWFVVAFGLIVTLL